jgi:hypothetical protein
LGAQKGPIEEVYFHRKDIMMSHLGVSDMVQAIKVEEAKSPSFTVSFPLKEKLAEQD